MVPLKLESAPVAIFFLCRISAQDAKTSPKRKFVEFFFCRGFLPAVLPAVFRDSTYSARFAHCECAAET
jgi:hypothetical protein